ncbi:MarR family winged helix-turn-helix transcriptional regulator [Rhodococcoides kyotonense]|uniref:DNA-binding transcriptional regulator, MarR family n=1 Tax=Rhodococcoides kyotonense TaxID=398843 RepID=A0A239MIU2_9NOCA|nr:hypothetical protein [Rhodococcus kyotonensis]SNT42581.1 DNA-binding transcriptional regulator, MarR family [Rhodococcus kyotonensis]
MYSHDLATTTQTRGAVELDIAATLIRVAGTVRTRLDEILVRYRVSWAGFEVLDLVCTDGPKTYRALAHHLDRHRTSVRSIVAGLVDSGYVTRTLGAARSDEFVVEPTESGRSVHDRARRALDGCGFDFLALDDPAAMVDQLRELDRGLRSRR